ncbi:hypothetical protein SVIOM74S_09904 [Streptomyces violarus]
MRLPGSDGDAPVAFPQSRTCPYQPPAAYDPLRGERPLTRITLFDGREAWLVSGHATARALLADPRLSSNRSRPGFPAPTRRFAGITNRRTALLGVDDPEHRTQRRMVVGDFTLKRAVELRPQIQQIVDERLDAMIAQGPPADLVTTFALPVPSMVICALLGVPYADHDFFETQSRRLLRGPETADVEDARDRLEAYFGELIDHKQQDPGTGLLDDLVHRQLRDGALDRDGLTALALILLVAGHETTANMISLGTYTLLQHPERLAELRADPGLLPAAVEELMRMLFDRRRSAAPGRRGHRGGRDDHPQGGRRGLRDLRHQPRRDGLPRSGHARLEPPGPAPRRLRLRHPPVPRPEPRPRRTGDRPAHPLRPAAHAAPGRSRRGNPLQTRRHDPGDAGTST